MAKKGKSSEEQKLSVGKKASRVFRFMGPHKGRFIVGFVFLVLSSLTALAFPGLLGQLFGASSPTDTEKFKLFDLENINSVVALLFIVFGFQAIFSFFRVYLFSIVTQNTLHDIRIAAFRKLVSSPLTFFNKNKVGELTSRIATDINLLQETLNTTIAEFFRQILTVIVGIGLLFFLSPELSLIMLAVVPVMALIAVFFGRFIRRLSREAQDEAASSNSILEEALTGIVNVKSFTNELFEIKRYTKAADGIKRISIKGGIWRGAFVSFIIFCLFGSIVFIIWRGVLLIESGDMDMKYFISFIMYTIFIGASIGSIPELYAKIQKALGATERLMAIIDEDSEDISLSHRPKKIGLKGEVEFIHVDFTYETRKDVEVLRDISFKASPGEQIAIVGPSGSGKSTLASLIQRFYHPNSGTILFDNKPADDYDISELRAEMAIVPQEVILFGGSIRENILYGRPDASHEEVKEAAQKAYADEFIERFPEGYNTIVGDRGIQLSGGQKQRIAIARAILKDPSILILDEATSSLDSESEKLVQKALNELMKGRTSFVIAHRLSTVRNADRIVVIQDGELKEMGTHEELISKQGIYKDLTQLQLT